jgi:hypothetical protein
MYKRTPAPALSWANSRALVSWRAAGTLVPVLLLGAAQVPTRDTLEDPSRRDGVVGTSPREARKGRQDNYSYCHSNGHKPGALRCGSSSYGSFLAQPQRVQDGSDTLYGCWSSTLDTAEASLEVGQSSRRVETRLDSSQIVGRGRRVLAAVRAQSSTVRVLVRVQVLYVHWSDYPEETHVPRHRQCQHRSWRHPPRTSILCDTPQTWSEVMQVVDGCRWWTRPASTSTHTVLVQVHIDKQISDPREVCGPTQPNHYARNRGRAPVDLCGTRRVSHARRGDEGKSI